MTGVGFGPVGWDVLRGGKTLPGLAPAGRPTSLSSQRSRQEKTWNTAAQPRTEPCHVYRAATSQRCGDRVPSVITEAAHRGRGPHGRSMRRLPAAAPTHATGQRPSGPRQRITTSVVKDGDLPLACSGWCSATRVTPLGARLGRGITAFSLVTFFGALPKKVTRPPGRLPGAPAPNHTSNETTQRAAASEGHPS